MPPTFDKTKTLKAERARVINELRTIVEAAEAGNGGRGRPLTRDERSKLDTFNGEIESLTEKIESREVIARSVLAQERATGMLGDGRDAEFRAWFANELRDFSTSGFGGALVPLDYQEVVWDRLRPASVFFQTNPTVINTERHQISLPSLTADSAASWVAEAGAIGETDPTGVTITVTPSKVAALTKFSRESADDSNPGVTEVIMRNLMQSIGLAVDKAAFEGTGASNQPTGLKNTSGIVLDNTTMTTNGSTFASLDPILSALSTLEGNNADMSKAVIVMHSRSWGELLKIKATTGQYLLESVQAGNAAARSIDGVPVFVSNQLSTTETQGSSNTASSVYVFDASQVIAVRREGLRLEATKDAFFSNDQIGLRGIARIGFAVPNPLAVVRLAGVL
jgi:HK97 family phage major capsid protein